MAQALPNPIRVQILLIADELKHAGSPVYVAQVRDILQERTGFDASYYLVGAELRLHGHALPGRGRPRKIPIPGFSVAV